MSIDNNNNNNNNYRSSSYRSGPSSLPPFINDLAETEILDKKYGPKDNKRKARLYMDNMTGELSKFGPVTQPVSQGDKFVMPIPRESRSSFSMLSDPEERAAQKRQNYEDKLDSMPNSEDRNFERWKDDNLISSFHEVETVGHTNTFDGQQSYEALQQKIAREEARQQHQRFLDTMSRTNHRFGFGGRRGGSRRFDSY
jgi:hypothetical protein